MCPPQCSQQGCRPPPWHRVCTLRIQLEAQGCLLAQKPSPGNGISKKPQFFSGSSKILTTTALPGSAALPWFARWAAWRPTVLVNIASIWKILDCTYIVRFGYLPQKSSPVQFPEPLWWCFQDQRLRRWLHLQMWRRWEKAREGLTEHKKAGIGLPSDGGFVLEVRITSKGIYWGKQESKTNCTGEVGVLMEHRKTICDLFMFKSQISF